MSGEQTQAEVLACCSASPAISRSERLSYLTARHINQDVIPSLAINTLSRSLRTIPLYGRLHSGNVELLSNAVAYASDARSTLKRSVDMANTIAALLPQLINKLKSLTITSSEIEAADLQETVIRVAILAQSTCDAVGHIYHAAGKISRELDAQLRQQTASPALRRWKSAIRAGSICVAVPSFATTILSSLWNERYPTLSFAMAVASASTGVCGTLAPTIAQWYWDFKEERLPWADMRSVHIETSNVQYPLSAVFRWWKKLRASLLSLIQWNRRSLEPIHDLELLAVQLEQYKREMDIVLDSVDSIGQVQMLRNVEDIV